MLKPGGTLCICNEMYRQEGKEAPYQYFVKTLDMSIYSRKELENAAAAAGFTDVRVVSHDKEGKVCVIARNPG
ncbi:MAG: hypothetical protein LBT60_01250 [Oscillospiraceae bacterium]|nr:hypothetical protein [Oscillospiraceae bacterium]